MDGLLDRLGAGEALLADGALGTMLIAAGLAPGACPEEWTLSRPAILSEIARRYAEAGADFVQTNTFGASPLKLSAYGLQGRAAEINTRAAALARDGVAGTRAGVRGVCGPSGKLLRPYGDTAPEQVHDGFEAQIRALVDGGVDLVAVETMTDLAEAVLAVRAAKAVAPALPVVAMMTFDRTPRGFFTVMGVGVEAACRGLAEAGADVVGANCGAGAGVMVDLAAEFRRATNLPIAVQPNAGLPALVDGKLTYSETPAGMAGRIGAILAGGAAVVGGCCGTTPEHIRAFRGVIDDWNRTRER